MTVVSLTQPPGAAPILEVRNLALKFGGIDALSDVSFAVQPGSITALIGPNGAGKTSLFNCISGFYKPFAGEILFQGQNINRVLPPQRAKLGLARSFQNIALFRGMTVLDNIKLGRHSHMRSNLLDGLLYWGRARPRKRRLPPRSRKTSSISWTSPTSSTSPWPTCRMACASASNWRAPWRCAPRSCCWTSRWPG